MLNIVSILIGLVALLLAIPSFLPLLGMGNWLVGVIALIGIGVGALSPKKGGRNFCLIVLVIAILRLMLGGGLV